MQFGEEKKVLPKKKKKSIITVLAVLLGRNASPPFLLTSVLTCQIPHIILMPVLLQAAALMKKGLDVNGFFFILNLVKNILKINSISSTLR